MLRPMWVATPSLVDSADGRASPRLTLPKEGALARLLRRASRAPPRECVSCSGRTHALHRRPTTGVARLSLEGGRALRATRTEAPDRLCRQRCNPPSSVSVVRPPSPGNVAGLDQARVR